MLYRAELISEIRDGHADQHMGVLCLQRCPALVDERVIDSGCVIDQQREQIGQHIAVKFGRTHRIFDHFLYARHRKIVFF